MFVPIAITELSRMKAVSPEIRTKAKKARPSTTLKFEMRPIPRAIEREAESVKKRQKTRITPSLSSNVFGIPSRWLASSPITGVPIPTVVIIAAK